MFKIPSALKIALLFVITAYCLPAGAQVHLDAHDQSIRYDLVKPEHSIYKTTFFDTAGKVTREVVIDHATIIDTAHNEIDFINSVPFAPGKLLIDSSIDNYSGSARYILATVPSTKHEYIKYLPNSVEAHNIIKGVSSTKTTPMREGYFDDNSIWDILGYIPFKKGIKYQLDCYGTDSHTEVSIPYEIEYLFDEDNLATGGSVVNSMVLKISSPASTNYIWINKKTHQKIKILGQGKGYSFTEVML
jgi:hypothetical protein